MGVLHAFDGKAKYADEAALRQGLFLSVPAAIGRSPGWQKMVKRVPLDRLLLETDSPALAPVPGEHNRIANLPLAAREIARLHNVDVQTVVEQTSRNAQRLWLDRSAPGAQ